MPKLHFPQPEFTTHSCDLPEGTTKVGRSSRNNLVLSDPSVSADHCEILVSWDEVIVRDHGSSNGTWVAGVRVRGQRQVNNGYIIRFGRVEARLELDGLPADDDDATAITAHFELLRAVQSQPVPQPIRVIIQRSPPDPETGDSTVSIPGSEKPVPPAVIAASKPVLPRPIPLRGCANHRWRVVLMVVCAAVVVAWLLRTFR